METALRGLAAFILVLLSVSQAFSKPETANLPHHDLKVKLLPTNRMVEVVDRITLPRTGQRVFEFALHRGLKVTVAGESAVLDEIRIEEGGDGHIYSLYELTVEEGEEKVTLTYSGLIHHELRPVGKEYARGFSSTPGIISDQGTVLSGSSFWVPDFDGSMLTFKLDVELPVGWDCVSQGTRELRELAEEGTRVVWSDDTPQEEVYLIAAPFTLYERKVGRATAMAYLRTPDEQLANKYLDATGQYLRMYNEMLGGYPFTKFALVENFWETGFGMPSFTLLGPRIIRFPFILSSSYPHEILHNWWGNSVYIDFAGGNWAEGLTAYLADHLIKEQRGSGSEHRVSVLQKYVDYVTTSIDRPLTWFKSRHSSSSEAIGYGKTMMVFHMLRGLLGDDGFIEGLRTLYRQHRWKRASWTDVRGSFEKATKNELGWFFSQWVEHPGAPVLELSDVRVVSMGERYKIKGRLAQTQQGKPYTLRVKLAVTLDGEPEAVIREVDLGGEPVNFIFDFSAKPVRLEADPSFDLFRRLDLNELSPALSGSFGAPRSLALIPSGASEKLREGYRALAETLGKAGPEVMEIISDDSVEELPSDVTVWVFGWENRFFKQVERELADRPMSFREDETDLGEATVDKAGHFVVATDRRFDDPENTIVFVAGDSADAMVGLGRKLPHYHKYSYLGFQGDEPANVAKGRWPVDDSPLVVSLTKGASRGTLPNLEPLAKLPPLFSKERMKKHVDELSKPSMEGRGFNTKGQEAAIAYIAGNMLEIGLEPGGDEGTYLKSWKAMGGDPETEGTLTNIIGVMKGSDPALADQCVIVGAHYDGMGYGWPDARWGARGKLHPSADDNGSGVSVMLEMARALKKSFGDDGPPRSILFIGFGGEEMARAGSKKYLADQCDYAPDKIMGMLNIDTVGRLGDRRLLALGGGSASEWAHIFRGAGFVTGVDVETVSKDIGSSDHASFIEVGIPAVQLFAGGHTDYHGVGDVPEKIDLDGMQGAAAIAKEAVEYLASRKEPLTNLIDRDGHNIDSVRKGSRKAFLGTVPDFSYEGEGVRVESVAEGSPAQKAGLNYGDIIIKLNGQPVLDLREYSKLLKRLNPGDKVKITYDRDGKHSNTEAVLKER